MAGASFHLKLCGELAHQLLHNGLLEPGALSSLGACTELCFWNRCNVRSFTLSQAIEDVSVTPIVLSLERTDCSGRLQNGNTMEAILNHQYGN